MQVSEMFELARKWEPVSDSLPHITDRLAALQQLHEQGTSCILWLTVKRVMAPLCVVFTMELVLVLLVQHVLIT